MLVSLLAKLYANHGRNERALDVLRALPAQAVIGSHPFTISSMIQVCSLVHTPGALDVGKSIFHTYDKRSDVGVVSAMIQLYVKCSHAQEALDVWEEWQKTSGSANEVLYASVLSACASLGRRGLTVGQQVHARIMNDGLLEKCSIQLVNILFNMYVKCGDPAMVFSLLESVGHHKFDKFTYSTLLHACTEVSVDALHHTLAIHARIQNEKVQLDEALLNALMTAYTKCGEPSLALQLGKEALHNSSLSATTYTCILAATAAVGEDAFMMGEDIFGRIAQSYHTDIKLAGALINMFAKCGKPEKALSIWQHVRNAGMTSTPVVYISALTACRALGQAAFVIVEQILLEYRELRKRGIADSAIVHSLLQYYARIRVVTAVRNIWNEFFGQSKEIGANSQACLLNTYIELTQPTEAIATWKHWRKMGLASVDRVPLICVLTACSNVGARALEVGKEVHALANSSEFSNDVTIVTALINMYCKCGEPLSMFPLWEKLCTLRTYNAITCICVLTACAALGTPGALAVGKQVHSLLLQKQDIKVDVVLMTALINMYTKCNAPGEAVNAWRDMTSHGVISNEHTYVALLSAFAAYPAQTDERKVVVQKVRKWLERGGVENSETRIALETALLNVYAKSGEIEEAEHFFAKMKERGIPHLENWTVMLGAYGSMLQGQKAVALFEQMVNRIFLLSPLSFSSLFASDCCPYFLLLLFPPPTLTFLKLVFNQTALPSSHFLLLALTPVWWS